MPKKNDDKMTTYAKVTINLNEYKKLKNGETRSNKGIRTKEGKLSTLPDIELISEDELKQSLVTEDYDDLYTSDVQYEEPDSLGLMLFKVIFESTVNAVVEVFSEEENRQIVWSWIKKKSRNAVISLKRTFWDRDKSIKEPINNNISQSVNKDVIHVESEFDKKSNISEFIEVSIGPKELSDLTYALANQIMLLNNLYVNSKSLDFQFKSVMAMIANANNREIKDLILNNIDTLNKLGVESNTIEIITSFYDGYFIVNGERKLINTSETAEFS